MSEMRGKREKAKGRTQRAELHRSTVILNSFQDLVVLGTISGKIKVNVKILPLRS